MMDDKRYDFDDSAGRPPIPAHEGWKRMQQMLDAELPVSKPATKRRYIAFLAAAVLCTVCMLNTLPLQQEKIFSRQFTTAPHSQVNTMIVKKGNHIKHNNVTPSATGATVGVEVFNTTKINSHSTSQTYLQHHFTANIADNIPPAIPCNGLTTENKNQLVIAGSKEKDNEDTSRSSVNIKSKKAGNTVVFNRWQYSAGAAFNVSPYANAQSLQPYPFADIRYYFTKHIFAGAAASVMSPASSNANGIKRTVYVNDTLNNVSKYNEHVNYSRLYYADAALFAGVQLTRHLSVHAGLQASRLLKSRTHTTLEPFDFDLNRVTVTNIDTLSVIPSAAPVYNNKVEANKYDVRYITGARYDFKKVSVGMQYQAGIKPVLQGTGVTVNKNKLVTVTLSYRFK